MAQQPSLVFGAVLIATVSNVGCERKSAGSGGGGDGDTGGASGQTTGDGGASAVGGDEAGGGTFAGPLNDPSGPRYHPREMFANCVHAPVQISCSYCSSNQT